MQSFNDCHDQLQITVTEVKKSLEFTLNEVEQSLKTIKEQSGTIHFLKTKLMLAKEEIERLTAKLDYQEKQARRNIVT